MSKEGHVAWNFLPVMSEGCIHVVYGGPAWWLILLLKCKHFESPYSLGLLQSQAHAGFCGVQGVCFESLVWH